jgi:hypothetical protein
MCRRVGGSAHDAPVDPVGGWGRTGEIPGWGPGRLGGGWGEPGRLGGGWAGAGWRLGGSWVADVPGESVFVGYTPAS